MIIRGALIQMKTEYSTDKNVTKAEGYVREAAEQGATLICLQELFNTVYFCHEMSPKHFALAEPIPGPTILRFQELARSVNATIVAPIFEKTFEGQYYNSAATIAPNGEILSIYRKSHIPLVPDPSIMGLEKYYFAPGDTGFITTPIEGARIGTIICYDRHFPEGARGLALNGAEIMLVPTATAGMSRYLWDLELRAHAVDNVFYVGGVNRVGIDSGGGPNTFYGSSMWVSPRGEIIAQGSDTDDDVVVADLDLAVIPEIRNQWGFFRDRRPDLYGVLSRGNAGGSGSD
jgi:beta-ureidopropionase